MPELNNNLIELLEFVNRLPLDKKQRLEFVEEHFKIIHNQIENNKQYFNKCLEQIKLHVK